MAVFSPGGKKSLDHLARSVRVSFLAVLFPLLAAAFLLSGQDRVEAEATEGNQLTGPPFSDPTSFFQMEPGWEERPIRYEKWAGDADLAVTLDQHLYPALLSAIEKYGREQGIKIAVQEGTCGISAGLLAAKSVDIAGFCCPPGAADRLSGLRYHTLAIGALAILAHPDNPVSGVTFPEAQRIYQGRIYRWSEIEDSTGGSGPEVPIHTVARLHCKARPGHWRLLLDREDHFGPRLLDVGSIQDVIRQVYDNPFAIGGFETLYMANDRYPPERKLRALEIDGFSPANQDHLASNGYPLYFTFNVTSWAGAADHNPHAEAFIKYLLQAIENVEPRYGMVPASRLKAAGWQFREDELVGAPVAPSIDSAAARKQ